MISALKISTLRKVDKIIGVSIIKAQNFALRKASPPKKPKKILVIKLFGFGNFIFLSPTFKAIKKLFPDAELHILTYRQNKEICEMYSEFIDTIHTINYSTAQMGLSILKFSTKHNGEYDIIFDFEQFVRLSAIIGRMLKPKYFFGICTKNSRKEAAFDDFIHYKEDKHVVDEYYSVVQHIAEKYGRKIDALPKLILPKIKQTKTVKKITLKQGQIPIGVCPGGRIDDVERKYPNEKFVEMLNSIAEDKRVVFFFFGPTSEKPDLDFIMSRLKRKDSYFDFSGTSLNDSAYSISKMKIFISNDTGPIHLAASLGVFCVGMYGPSKEWVYGPYTNKKLILRDEKHTPVRSNHNEKNKGWSREWWTPPKVAAKKISKLI